MDHLTLSTVDEYAPQSLLDRISGPLETATSLPNSAYTSRTFFALEQRYVFRRTWMLAARVDDLEKPGDIVPVDVAGMPLILVRDTDDQIRAFQNVCRHRGAQMVDTPCRGRQSIVCPYHSWTYGLDGRLQRRPHFHGGDCHDVLTDSDIGLFAVRCEVWHHWVMVNIDGNAPPLCEVYAFMDGKLTGYDFDAAVHAGTLEFSLETNWKFAHENFIEPYHVFSAHPRLTAFVTMPERQPSKVEEHVMWNYYQFKSAEEGRGLGLPHFPNLDDELSMRGIWFTVFPSFGIEIYPDHIALLHVNPVSPSRCVEHIEIYLIGEAATATQYEEGRRAVLDMWQELNQEDVGLLEMLQKGRSAPGYDGGLLSPYWDEAPRNFARMLLQTLRDEAWKVHGTE